MDQYNPHICNESINFSGVYICKLQTVPCALHTGEVCYRQKADEAISKVIQSMKGDDKE